MTKAIRIHEHGGPEVLKWEDVEVGAPGPDEVRLKTTAAGLNFIDTYHRTGMYKIALPSVIGREGAGIVEAVGTNVTSCKVGDRVAYASSPMGAYAEARLMPADRVVKIPAAISDQQAASMMLKGMTAQYLLRRTYRVKAGDVILSQAAAGGVGLILGQWAKHLGATVIGTVGSEEKMALAKANGCDYVINYRKEDFQARVMEITNGKKCQVVYDGVGQDTWAKSLDCIAPLGMMVSFGAASGAVKPFYIGELAAKGSLYLTRPTLDTYTATRADLVATTDELFAIVASGVVKIEVNQTYALRDTAQAHRDLEARKTTGSTVLIP
ncbi:MAG: quinone oxidoreductase [Rhodocyclaceae bacterium]|jgi:NADPH2:quinone reductase|nr:quinone oxidoreductase [Rhodocyclaceae bacterium]MCA3032834.1 quinone oxidoreductase [Rhodocyclaceae bacterium]MCA3038049.1 quinone oxidoreductase [Rhodocyclaceae bacterium]MCA3039653.1 quinone oxidoreductase [Rhodocyclaceae bacterium]MCA3044954.1 quinone oxidoreductase [Rhodocyclaceae bacterium]